MKKGIYLHRAPYLSKQEAEDIVESLKENIPDYHFIVICEDRKDTKVEIFEIVDAEKMTMEEFRKYLDSLLKDKE